MTRAMKGRVAPLAALGLARVALAGEVVAPVPTPPPAYRTVVTAPPAAAPTPREDASAAASVVLPADSPRALDDLASLLVEVPGVTVTRSGSLGSVATLALRGGSPDEVRIYVDGVPLAVAEGGAVDVSTLPLGDVERVEIYRGSTPLAFGESALGGVVAITTRTPGAPRAQARAGGGSWGTMFGDASGGGRAGPLRLYVGAHGLMSRGGFGFTDDGCTALNPADDQSATRLNNDVRQADGVVRAAVDLPGRRELSAGALAFGRAQGLPGSQCSAPFGARFRTARGLAYLRYLSRDDLGDGGRLALQLFGSGQRNALDDPFAGASSVSTVTHDTTLSLGASAHARRPVTTWLGAAAILEGRAESFRATDDLAPMPLAVPARRLVGAAGAELDVSVPRLDLDVIPSARVEAVNDVVTGRDPLTAAPRAADAPITRTLPIFRLGIVRAFGPAVALKANAGRYARVPTFFELYGDNGRVLGNPALRPERGTSADLGVWIDVARRRLALASRTTAYAARVDDLIAWQFGAYGARAGNLSQTRVLGAEQELRLGVGRHARAVAQVMYTDARDLGPAGVGGDGVQIPFHPRWHAYARPELVRLAAGRAVEVGAFVDADWRARTYVDLANVAAERPRLLLGVGLTADVPRWQVHLAASGQNLNDSRIGDFPNWPLPGRSFFVSLTWMNAFENPRSN